MIRIEPQSARQERIIPMLDIDMIRVDGGTQSRADINQAVVDEYAAAIGDGATFPPVVVFYDGSERWLADGFHRFRAHQQLGLVAINADIRQGDRRDAILYSVGANETHGLRRTNEDKRRAVLTLLSDDEWKKWSDREIGRRCNVHHETVGRLKLDLTGENASERLYTTKHGTVATMNTAGIGKNDSVSHLAAAPSETEEMEEDMQVAEVPQQAAVNDSGPRMMVPDGADLIELCKAGLKLEEDGASGDEAAVKVGLSKRAYAISRQIVLLADHPDLTEADAALAKSALNTLVSTRRVWEAWGIVEQLALRVWGEGRRFNLVGIAAERLERFRHALGIVTQGCITGKEIDLPYLAVGEIEKSVKQINEAVRSLRNLKQRIERLHE